MTTLSTTTAAPPAATASTRRKQTLYERIAWFLAGGVFSPSLDTGLTWLLVTELHLTPRGAYPLGVLVTAVVFFLWNYYVNFRTASIWKHCAGRYLLAFTACWAFTSLLGSLGIHHLSEGHQWSLIWVIATVTKLLTGPLKFALYHFWVFPHGKPQPAKV